MVKCRALIHLALTQPRLTAVSCLLLAQTLRLLAQKLCVWTLTQPHLTAMQQADAAASHGDRESMVLVGFERRDSVDQMDFVHFAQRHFEIEELAVRRTRSTATACFCLSRVVERVRHWSRSVWPGCTRPEL